MLHQAIVFLDLGSNSLVIIGVGDGGMGDMEARVSQNSGNIFGQLLCKIRAFFGQNYVKFGNFVNFSYIFFWQKCLPPKVDCMSSYAYVSNYVKKLPSL